MRITDQTRDTAQRVVDYIVANPERHNQQSWWAKYDEDGDIVSEDIELVAENANICDTAMCVAGTAVLVTRTIEQFKDFASTAGTAWESEGAELLGLDEEEAQALFYCMNNSRAFEALVAIANGDQDKFEQVLYS